MKANLGNEKERLFVQAVNGKSYKELPNGIRRNLRHMYQYIEEEDIIKSERIGGSQKPDFYVEIKDKRKNISLKTGLATDVGQIELKTFITYLRKQGISETTLKTIVYLHFGDGTLNGTGKKRYDAFTFRQRMDEEIHLANLELNRSKDFIKAFVHLVVFKGFYEENIEADYLYFGDENHGYCCNQRQVNKCIENKKWAYMKCLHIGPIQFRALARYVNSEIKDESRRWKVLFSWPHLEAEIEKIGRFYPYQYDGYIPVAERKERESTSQN